MTNVKLTSWTRSLPPSIRKILGVLIVMVVWPLVILILLVANIYASVKDFFHYLFSDIKKENKFFIDFFKCLFRE